MPHPRRPIILLVFAVIVVAAAAAAFLLTHAPGAGVIAEIRNTGVTPLRNVHVHVTGRSYPLGDLQPGQSAAVRVDPAGESDIRLSYADPAGAPQSLTAGGYLESGYRGRITVDVANGQVTRFDSHLNAY